MAEAYSELEHERLSITKTITDVGQLIIDNGIALDGGTSLSVNLIDCARWLWSPTISHDEVKAGEVRFLPKFGEGEPSWPSAVFEKRTRSHSIVGSCRQ